MAERATMTEADAVLAENLEFYRAFSTRDMASMEQIWARAAPLTCIHPGWTPVRGRDAVLESWRRLLAHPEAPQVLCYEELVEIRGGVGIVTCEEELPGGSMIATNLFIPEAGRWRMIRHHASPLVMRGSPSPRRPGA